MSCALVHFLSCSGGSPASSYSSSHFLFIYLIDSSFFFTLLFNIFLSSLPLRLVLIGLFPCFFILTTMMVCDWLRCVMWPHVPPTCPLASCLQWAALSGLWVWALAPQALQPLAGCTGAFPGQVLSTTCVPPPPPGVVYFFSLAQYSGLPAQTGSDFRSSHGFHYIPSSGI